MTISDVQLQRVIDETGGCETTMPLATARALIEEAIAAGDEAGHVTTTEDVYAIIAGAVSA